MKSNAISRDVARIRRIGDERIRRSVYGCCESRYPVVNRVLGERVGPAGVEDHDLGNISKVSYRVKNGIQTEGLFRYIRRFSNLRASRNEVINAIDLKSVTCE